VSDLIPLKLHFAIDAGHNASPGDIGAVGFAIEDELTAELGSAIVALLRAAGQEVTECKVPHAGSLIESLRSRVEQANDSGADIYVSLHFNKFLPDLESTDDPMGSEIFVCSQPGGSLASKVMPELTKLGFKIHDSPDGSGIKNSSLYVLVHTQMTAILIESFFLDSQADYAVFQSVGIDGLAKAIVKGLLS
jgi:N-acetylmuramoyl-L-alanine amidase